MISPEEKEIITNYRNLSNKGKGDLRFFLRGCFSYFLATTGQVTLEDLKRYVENQVERAFQNFC